MRSVILEMTVVYVTAFSMYFFLRWRGVEVKTPIRFALFGMAFTFMAGVLLTTVTGNVYWFWSFGKVSILAGPMLYVMIWLIRKYTSTHHA